MMERKHSVRLKPAVTLLFFLCLLLLAFPAMAVHFTTDGQWAMIGLNPEQEMAEAGGVKLQYCGVSSSITIPCYVRFENNEKQYKVIGVFLGEVGTDITGEINLTNKAITQIHFQLADGQVTTVQSVTGPTIRPSLITSINFPEGVSSIAGFGTSTLLETVHLPETLKTLGYGAFDGSASLKNINLEHVETFGTFCLRGTAIESLPLLNSSVQTIESNSFENCRSLTDAAMPSSLQSIGYGSFKGCDALKTFSFADNCQLSVIGARAFDECTSLEEMILPDTVTTIDMSAFRNCSEMKRLHLSDHLVLLEGDALSGCDSLEELTLPASLKSMGSTNACSLQLRKLTIEEGAGITRVPFSLKSLEELYAPVSVTSAYDANTSEGRFPHLKIAVVANTDLAGGARSTLEELTILDPGTTISLSNYTALRKVTLPDDMTKIPGGAFSGCVSLSEINLPSELQTIGQYAFRNCAITEVDIPDGVTVIDGAFIGCTSLRKIRMHGGIYSIVSAFQGCTSLTEVEMPYNDDDETELKMSNAFQDCTSLTEIWIPPQVKSLAGSFSGCTALNNVMISPLQSDNWRITNSGSAFEGCTGLKGIYLPPDRFGNIGSRMFANSGMEEIEIPEGITGISANAFQGSSSLWAVYLPQSLVSIGNYAFADCQSLHLLDVPDPAGIPYNALENDTIELITSQGKSAWNASMQSDEDGITHSFRDPLRFAEGSDIGVEMSGNTITIRAPEAGLEGSFIYRYILTPGYDEYNENSMTAQGTNKLSAAFTVEDTNMTYTAKVIVGRTSYSIDTSSVRYGYDGDERVLLWDPVNAYVDENGEIQFVSGYSQLAYLPADLQRIEEGAFDTASLAGKMIVLHNGVNEIGAGAFANTDIAAIFIPESVTNIGAGAFDGCDFTIFCAEGSWADEWSDSFEHVMILPRSE